MAKRVQFNGRVRLCTVFVLQSTISVYASIPLPDLRFAAPYGVFRVNLM